jgi:phage N-6-adenine-methyltransferase
MSASGEIRRAADGGKNNWRTPRALFDLYDSEWGFTLDGAADSENALCGRYYSEECDAFSQCPEGEVIWCNPPYGDLKRWIELFVRWSQKNIVIALVPSATDTVWFADAWKASKEITLLTGRVRFINPVTDKADGSNTTGSAIFRMTPAIGCSECPHVDLLDWTAEQRA